MIIPAEQPAYVAVPGGNELILLGEFSRTCPVECAKCGLSEGFKLCTDELLSDDECDQVLNEHLRAAGWTVGDDDVCPACAF